VTNPVVSLRDKSNLPVKVTAVHRVPLTIYSKNDTQTKDLKLQVDSFDSVTSSTQDYATVGRDALLQMKQALERASPLCGHVASAKLEQTRMKQEYEALDNNTDVLAETLNRVVQGSVDASGLEVAKVAQKMLENREIWEEYANRTLQQQQDREKFRDEFALELLAAVPHGITSIRTYAVAASVKVNFTKVSEEFFDIFNKGTSSVDFESEILFDLLEVGKAINESISALTVSQNLTDGVVQDAAAKKNSTDQLQFILDRKENLTNQIYERVRLTENLSHATGQLPGHIQEKTGSQNLTMGIKAAEVSASQASALAEELQNINRGSQEVLNVTLELDLQIKLKGLTLEKTIREALKTCALGLRLARLAGAQVTDKVERIFVDVHGIFGNVSSAGEFLLMPKQAQSAQLAALQLGEAQPSQPSDGDPGGRETKEVKWTVQDPSTVETTTLLFGSPRDPPVPAPIESTLLPNLLIASAISLSLILVSVLAWIIAA